MHINQKRGRIGENLACKYLEKNGYTLIERNFYCRQGEIDIVACDNIKKELVFFEVKTRSGLKYGKACESVNKMKQKHILSVIKYYIYKNHIKGVPIRIDVIEVYLSNSNYKINHIKQAFIN